MFEHFLSGQFAYVDGERYYVTKEKPQAGDFMLYTKEDGFQYFGICQCVSINGDSVIRECHCGQCTIEENIIPIKDCKKVVHSPIEAN